MARKTETQAQYKTISASITREFDKEVTDIAKKMKVSKSELMRNALRDYISRK